MTELPTDRLAQLIDQKQQCLVVLRDFGVRQRSSIDSGNMPELLRILSAKQQLIVTLQQVEQQLDEFRDEDPQQRAWRSPVDRERCAEQAQQCRVLLQEVLELERSNEAAIIDRRQDTAERLQQLHSGDRARGAYNKQQGSFRPHLPVANPHEQQSNSLPHSSIDLISEA